MNAGEELGTGSLAHSKHPIRIVLSAEGFRGEGVREWDIL